ncbi:MAG: copper resistance CopC family protein, partial [Actinomycetota bacterium]
MYALRRALLFACLVPTVLIAVAAPSLAHTGFESSDPADGATRDEPVDTVTIRFTGPAEPAGDGFEVLDPSGAVRQPVEAVSDDGTTWTLRFDPPIAGGTAGLRWTVKAPDAHPIEGSFAFTAGGSPRPDAPDADADADLDTFLTSSRDDTGATRLAAVGRMIGMTGATVGIGAMVFAAAVLRGSRRDIRTVTFWVRRCGVLVVVGAALELVAQLAIESGGSIGAGLTDPTALTAALAAPKVPP